MNKILFDEVVPWAIVIGFIAGFTGKLWALILFIVSWIMFSLYCLTDLF